MTAGQPDRIVLNMPNMTIPTATVRVTETPFRCETLVTVLKGLFGITFTGYLSVRTVDRLFLLFIFQGHPYSAGLYTAEKPSPLTITNFCAQVATIYEGTGSISLHETDPVLLKCLLVFFQDEPAAKGAVNLINLKGMMDQIHKQASDALVILEHGGRHNFFFFLDGTKTAAYWSEGEQVVVGNELSVDEQMLLYASMEKSAPVTAIVYQTLNTMESMDSANMTLEGLVRLFAAVEDTEKTISPVIMTVQHYDQLRLKVLEGVEAGSSLCGSFPCMLGRKDADIIINDPMVSKRHAAIQIINGKLMLIDLNSTNGTMLNDKAINQQELKQGDRISIGQTTLLVEEINLS